MTAIVKNLLDPNLLHDSLAAARQQLLGLRGQLGHWEGELSASAISTATAICALAAYRKAAQTEPLISERLQSLIEHGRLWLVENQNPDGGWGDTTASFSNISTTALCWAALAGCRDQHLQAAAAAECWLSKAAGSLEPADLAAAIRRRYGKDHTFSVPILTTLALTGRLGNGRDAWCHVPQLPFELAAFPHRLFAWLRLPVVSYALPALIAIGQVRHRHRPSRNPLVRWARRTVMGRTLRKLREIQPPGGGFLEATPLTSFVVLSLVGAGRADNLVARDGVEFIVRSVRSDGSWPIDTNLATWVTTLSIHALACGRNSADDTFAEEFGATRRWLLEQQYRLEHPYTHAAPGGWAWTDLPGGVPDADDTPGALIALKTLDDSSHEVGEAAQAGIRWLLDLQNADGGMPTFCRGWGNLPFDRSSADLTAHALRAWLAWRDTVPLDLQARMRTATSLALRYLERNQQADGAWAPLWFGNQHAPDEINLTYGTSRVLVALVALRQCGQLPDHYLANLTSGLAWLVGVQNGDGGWGGAANTPSSVEETSLAVEALCFALDANPEGRQALAPGDADQTAEGARRGLEWLLKNTDCGRHFPASPIGFYFAKLWYFERLYPVSFAIAALSRADQVRTRLWPQPEMPARAPR